MKSSPLRSSNILFQRFLKAFRSLLICLFLVVFTPTLHAILDTNQNGVSDLWEKKYYQGSLFSTFDPLADPDADGWTHAQEAAAGTDPFSSNPLTGHVRPALLQIPAAYLSPAQAGGPATLLTPAAVTLTWPTLAGKRYTVLYSSDLTPGSWSPLGTPVTGTGSVVGTGVTLTQPDGSTPPKIFLKVAIADQDSDADTLTDAEEAQLGTNALSNDTDSDGMPDAWEVRNGLDPTVNDSTLDPDGDGLTNLQEFAFDTSPTLTDTDGDGAPDSTEVAAGSDPNASSSVPPAAPFFVWASKQLSATQDGTPSGGYVSDFSYFSVSIGGTGFGGYTWNFYNSSAAIVPETGNSELKNFAYQPIADRAHHGDLEAFSIVKVGGLDLNCASAPDRIVYSFFEAATSHDVKSSRNNFYRRFESIGYNLRLENDLTYSDEITRSFLKVHLKTPSPPPYNGQYGDPFRYILATDYTVVEADTKVVKLTIPKGKKFSPEYELEPPLVETGMCHLVTLLPVEVKDIKDSAKTDDDVTITPWDSATQPNPRDENIAWIEPHKSATDPAPRMPQLELKIAGLPATTTLQAKFEVKYTRGNGTRANLSQPEDRVRIPADGSFQTVTGDTWKIWEAYANETFFGGEATLTYKLMTGATETLAPQTIKFRIGGKNPTPARAKTYIESLPNAGPQGSLWFAYAIAKSESQDYNGEGSRYNQFLRLPQNPINNGRPLWGNDPDATTPGGYGIFQVTGTASVPTENIPRKQIWNWQDNAIGGLVIITSKWTLSNTWMVGQRNQALQQRGQAVPVGNRTEAAVTFSEGTSKFIEHAVTMKAYNGASRGHYCAWDNTGQGVWKFNPLNILNFNYTNRVCTEVEP